MADPQVRIAPAREELVEQLLAGYEWLFAPPGSVPAGWSLEAARPRLRAAIESDGSVVLAATRNRHLIGFCTAYLDFESVRFGLRCWVEDLAVAPDARSRGVGAALLAAARQWGAERGATHLELDSGEARHDAHRFYDREAPAWRSKQYTWVLHR